MAAAADDSSVLASAVGSDSGAGARSMGVDQGDSHEDAACMGSSAQDGAQPNSAGPPGGTKRKRGFVSPKDIPVEKEEVDGWESMSKKGLKRAIKVLRARKLAAIKAERRKANTNSDDPLFVRSAEDLKVGIPLNFQAPLEFQHAVLGAPCAAEGGSDAVKVPARVATRLRLVDGMQSAPGLLLDHSELFQGYMKHSERGSLAQQFTHMYASNRSAQTPLWLGVAGVTPQLEQTLLERGAHGWAVHAFREEFHKVPALGGRRLVYLSAEATDVLQEVRADTTYVIGALVDRNRHKGAAMARAKVGGVPTARLPLAEHVDLKQSPVLTCLHVMQMLLRVWNGEAWSSAVPAVLPARNTREKQEAKAQRREAKRARVAASPAAGSEEAGDEGSARGSTAGDK